MHFGMTLRLLRVDAGLSLRSLAREIGVSSAYLSRVENGHDPAPTPERLSAIAGAIDVSPEMLVELADQTSAALGAYIERVPAANGFFLEVARRGLDAGQLARLREFMGRELSFTVSETDSQPSLESLIGARVFLGRPCASIDEVIAMAAEHFAAGTRLQAAHVACRICEREDTATTVLGDGVAVPHAIIEGAPTRIALVTLARELPGPTSKGVSTVFVLMSGTGGQSHLQVLARLARQASYGVAARLRGVMSEDAAVGVIREIEGF